jgi:hypothetical protein
MIYNCQNCCKSISSKSEKCHFCGTNVAEFSMLVEKRYKDKEDGKHSPLAEILRGTLATLKL